MMYRLLRKILFSVSPESAHWLALSALAFFSRFKKFPNVISDPIQIGPLFFPNRIGLAAGLDKNGDYIDALAKLGFGFIEVGTVTPKPQAGNPPPRLFRLIDQEALINRMGFNNKGVDYLVSRLKTKKFNGIVGVNIGKNADTPLEKALLDFEYCFAKVAPYSSYVAINLSSPNTSGLRLLQHGDYLKNLLTTLKNRQKDFFKKSNKYVPLFLKVSPDLDEPEIKQIAGTLLNLNIDGLIATNTSIQRPHLVGSAIKVEEGGLSGKPLFDLSNKVIKQFSKFLQNKLPIIGVGGIFSASDVKEKIEAGATLVQCYTGVIYQGPSMIKNLKTYSTVTDFAKFRG